MVVETQEATRRVTLVAQTPPQKLPRCPEFAWTALLTAQQRQRLQQDARRDLELVAQHVDKHAVDVLNRNLLTAAYLLNRPEIAATLPVDWDVTDAWFWTPEWQAGEREAEADFAAGRVTRHDSDEEFLAALRGRRAVHADAS